MSPQPPARPALGAGILRIGRRSNAVSFLAQAARRPPRILVVKTHDQLGDFLVATPALAALRARFPEARIELVTRGYLAPLARRQPALDAVHVLGRGAGALAAVSLLPKLRHGPPDLALVLNSVSRSRTADLVAALSGARMIVGRSRVGAGAPDPAAPPDAFAGALALAASGERGDPVYDLDLEVAASSAHQVDRLLDLVRWTGAIASAPGMVLAMNDAGRARGRAVLAAARPDASATGPIVGLHPTAANALKCWPEESFVELGCRLAATGASLLVFDTPKEPGSARSVVDGLARRAVAAGLVPAGPLDAFVEAASGLDLMVCNDSGVMHVAAALGVRTLSFHSLGWPGEWAPRSATALALHAEAIAGIGVDAAERAARRLLAVAS